MRIHNREVDVIYGIGISLAVLFLFGMVGLVVASIVEEVSLPDDASQYKNCRVLQNERYVKCTALSVSAKTFDKTKIANTLFKGTNGKPYLEVEYCGDQLSNGHEVCSNYEFLAKTEEDADRVTEILIDGGNK